MVSGEAIDRYALLVNHNANQKVVPVPENEEHSRFIPELIISRSIIDRVTVLLGALPINKYCL